VVGGGLFIVEHKLSDRALSLTAELFDECTGNVGGIGWVTPKVLDAVINEAQKRGLPKGMETMVMIDWLIDRFGGEAVLQKVKNWTAQENRRG